MRAIALGGIKPVKDVDGRHLVKACRVDAAEIALFVLLIPPPLVIAMTLVYLAAHG